MNVIWKYLQPLFGPAVVALLTLLAAWFVYSEGKLAGRAIYADDIAACEQRRSGDHAKLMSDREAVLAEKTALLEAAKKQLEDSKRETERYRVKAAAAESDGRARHAALDAALASLRFKSAGGAVPMSDAAGAATEPDAAAEECRSGAAELVSRCAHDALTVMEWQAFYRSLQE